MENPKVGIMHGEKSWEIVSANPCVFVMQNASDATERVFFLAETRGGSLYSKVLHINKGGRAYQAARYHYNYVQPVQEMANNLLKAGRLWDYEMQISSIEARRTKNYPI